MLDLCLCEVTKPKAPNYCQALSVGPYCNIHTQASSDETKCGVTEQRQVSFPVTPFIYLQLYYH